jgi:hypothetical protein
MLFARQAGSAEPYARSTSLCIPKLDHFLRPAAVAVIAIPLAFRRQPLSAASADDCDCHLKANSD